jgi:hypothetical protein
LGNLSSNGSAIRLITDYRNTPTDYNEFNKLCKNVSITGNTIICNAGKNFVYYNNGFAYLYNNKLFVTGNYGVSVVRKFAEDYNSPSYIIVDKCDIILSDSLFDNNSSVLLNSGNFSASNHYIKFINCKSPRLLSTFINNVEFDSCSCSKTNYGVYAAGDGEMILRNMSINNIKTTSGNHTIKAYNCILNGINITGNLEMYYCNITQRGTVGGTCKYAYITSANTIDFTGYINLAKG